MADRKALVTRSFPPDFFDGLTVPPLKMRPGDPMTVVGGGGGWPPFVEVVTPRGERGFVPRRHLKLEGTSAVAAEPYDTTTLDPDVGEVLTVLAEDVESGWFWCRDSEGNDGWFAIDHLAENDGVGNRYAPRKLGLDGLLKALVDEHAAIKGGLKKVGEAASRSDYEGVRSELRNLEPLFRQHIADEEAQVLGMLIRVVGVTGAAEEIKVFQQHRPIHELMLKVAELASRSPDQLEARRAELDALFELHTSSEETAVFPRAARLSGARAAPTSP